MVLEPGSCLLNYEIVEPLGSGGMGEVYRARDTKLGREVAIKVLSDEFSRDRERLDRFEREAKVLAALNHPGIAHLYGFEEAEGQHFIAMELVEGETLAERIPMALEDAIPLSVQMAEALEAAHEKGIVHRDLKTPNVMITSEGQIKILDFGLAKTFAPEENVPAETSQSPTRTRGTALGTIMGTASYMSPEQARGKRVDKRTDIWAFGCCLYEALTGRKAFEGETVSDIIGAVMRAEPEWDALPAAIRALVGRCLVKDARQRLRDIGDVRLQLEDAGVPASEPSTPKMRSGVSWPVAAAAVLAASLLAWFLHPSSPPRDLVVAELRLSLEPAGRLRERGGGPEPPLMRAAFALSDDGRTIAFTGGPGANVRCQLDCRTAFAFRALQAGILDSGWPDAGTSALLGERRTE